MRASYLTVLRGSSFFLLRSPPGRRRARVAPAMNVHSWAPADALGERARDAVFVQAFNAKRETAHGARAAPLGNLAAPRPEAGKGIPKRRIRVFSFYETRTRFFLCLYLFPSQRRGAVLFSPPCFSHAFNTESTSTFLSLDGASGEKSVARRKC